MPGKFYPNPVTDSDATLFTYSTNTSIPSQLDPEINGGCNEYELDEFSEPISINSISPLIDDLENPKYCNSNIGYTDQESRDSLILHSDYRNSTDSNTAPDAIWPQHKTTPLNLKAISTGSFWQKLICGPDNPREAKITPVIKTLQFLPSKLNSQLPPILLKSGLATFLILWIFLFYQLLSNSLLEPANVNGQSVQLVGCGQVDDVWKGINQACGVDGKICEPFDDRTFLFKCPAGCAKGSWTYSAKPVGNFSSIYRPYVIGGDNKYRADSSICGAGVHQGVISNRKGGCARIRFKGFNPAGFRGYKGKGGVESIGFDSFFSASFSFDSYLIREKEWVDGCSDLRFFIIGVNIVLSLVFGYFVVSPQFFFWTLTFMGFWMVVFVSDPPVNLEGSSPEIWSKMISLGFRRLLPTTITSYVIYHFCVSRTLENLDASLSRSLLWVGGFWLGLLENYTFESLPIDRLIISDINKQPGGWAAVIFLLILVIVASLNQAYTMWYSGKLKSYLILYGCLAGGVFILTLIPGQTLRVHHYVIALVLLPGTSFQTTPSLLYQGILVGLFIFGVARWDFDSILQTTDELRRGDSSLLSGIPSFISFNATSGAILWKALENETPKIKRHAEPKNHDSLEVASPTLFKTDFICNNGKQSDCNSPLETSQLLSKSSFVTESALNSSAAFLPQLAARDGHELGTVSWDGFSLIVNDIEVYRGADSSFDLTRYLDLTKNIIGKRIYLRLAYTALNESFFGDYTKAGVLTFENTTWVWNQPESGPFGV